MTESQRKTPIIRLLGSEQDDDPAYRAGRRLTQLSKSIDHQNSFHKEQLIKWKAGLKNRRTPAYDMPAVVREVADMPFFDEAEITKCSGNPYYREPLTLRIGILDEEGDYLEYWVDGRRLEPF